MEFLRFVLEERPKQPVKHPIGGDVSSVSVSVLERREGRRREMIFVLFIFASLMCLNKNRNVGEGFKKIGIDGRLTAFLPFIVFINFFKKKKTKRAIAPFFF